ncbi:MAG: hypothetical protein ACRBM6_24810 [Geminicoccales bacterium]
MRHADGPVVAASSEHQINEDFASIAEEISDLLTRLEKKPRLAPTPTETTRIDLARLPKDGEYLLGLDDKLSKPANAHEDLDSAKALVRECR